MVLDPGDEEPTANKARPALADAILGAHAGAYTVLIVASLTDLGGSPAKALGLASKLATVGVTILSASEPWTAEAGPVLGQIGGWLEVQAPVTRSATSKESLRKARAAGRRVGRPRKTVDVAAARTLLAQHSLTEVAKRLRVDATTLRRALAQAESLPSPTVAVPPACFPGAGARSIDETVSSLVA